jgi:hypothetical protein
MAGNAPILGGTLHPSQSVAPASRTGIVGIKVDKGGAATITNNTITGNRTDILAG